MTIPSSTPRRHRRTLTAAATLLALALILSACGSKGSTATEPTGEQSGTSADPGAAIDAGTPVDGGTLVWGLDADTDSFSPMSGRWDRSGHLMGSAIFDPLTTLDAKGQAVPYLAQSLTPNADATVWTIDLRPGVTFHDGELLDAAAVVKNLTEQKKALITGQSLAGVKDVTAVDADTVQVTTAAPWATFPVILASQVGYMAAPKMIDDQRGGEHPIGTGPFVFQDWTPGDHMTATKNPHYWQPGLPHLDEINFKVVTDTQQQVDNVTNGTFDAFTTSAPSSIATLRTDSDINLLQNDRGEERFASLNTQKAPFNNLLARQALAYATDLDAFIAANGSGVYEPVAGMFAPGQLGNIDGDTGYPTFDLAKAKQAVADYTTQTGQPLAFTFLNTSSDDDLKVSHTLADMWNAAGMQVTLRNVGEQDEVVAVVLGDYQAADWRNFGQPDPDGDYIWWHSSSIGKDGSLSLNTARYSTPQIDAALDAARATTDLTVRDQQYQQAERQINAGLPYIWLARVTSAIAADKRVHGYGEAANGTDANIGPKTWVAKLWIEPTAS